MRAFGRAAVRAGLALFVWTLIGPGAGTSHRLIAAQQPAAQRPATPQDPQQPTFRSGVNFVRVDVIATDKTGEIVPNLKPEDFEVTEQGRPQKIETFKLVSLDGGLMATGADRPQPIRSDEDEQREAAKDDVRLFGIFLDDYHVKLQSSMGARRQLAQFVDTQLGPSDMVGVMYPLEQISQVLMTRDHDAIKRGLEEFRGRKFDYTPTNPAEEQYAHYPTEVVESIRNDVSLTALRSLIIHMGGLKDGRKALILVSEGYSAIIPPQLRDADAANPGSGNPNRYNPSAGADGDVNETRAENSADADMALRLRDIFEEANHYNVSIYSVDPRMLATNEFGIDMPAIDERVDLRYLNSTMDTLRTLSDETEGRAIVNTNQLAIGMKQIVKDTSAYYLLGYNSSFTAPDGKFHEIKVRVKKPGVEVRARKGYWALNRDELAAVTAPKTKPEAPTAVQKALTAMGSSVRERVVRTWLGTERGDDGKTKVTFVWEPAPRVAGDPLPASAEQAASVQVTAVGPDGTPYFRGRAPAVSSGAAATSGGKVAFDVPAGTLQLRLTVQGPSSNTLDTDTREIPIPDLTAPQTSLSTPEVFRARTPRDFQQIRTDPQAVPVVTRDFVRTDRLLIRVSAYGPGSVTPALKAKLLNRAGQSMADLPVTTADGKPSEIELPLAALASGEYLIQIDASGDGGPAQEVLGFRITG